ncbi:hypothetical protein MCP1_490012 [Candidatus Terasakiella magnetica]|nr:hypothetical protein MCP1_490012 [Candidatus Terasakiella magnetica]
MSPDPRYAAAVADMDFAVYYFGTVPSIGAMYMIQTKYIMIRLDPEFLCIPSNGLTPTLSGYRISMRNTAGWSP